MYVQGGIDESRRLWQLHINECFAQVVMVSPGKLGLFTIAGFSIVLCQVLISQEYKYLITTNFTKVSI